MLNPQTMKSNDVVPHSNRFADISAAGEPVLARYGFPAFGRNGSSSRGPGGCPEHFLRFQAPRCTIKQWCEKL
ncbi:hypothetical protein ABIA70_001472 [Arthrobacter sp. 754]